MSDDEHHEKLKKREEVYRRTLIRTREMLGEGVDPQEVQGYISGALDAAPDELRAFHPDGGGLPPQEARSW